VDRVDVARLSRRYRALDVGPAEVSTGDADRDLLFGAGTDVADEQIAVVRLKIAAEGVAKAVGPDQRVSTDSVGPGIVARG